MDTLITSFNATIPTFILILAGAWADRWFPNLSIETLSKLAIYLFLPALMFDAIVGTSLSLNAALLLASGYCLYLIFMAVIAWFSSKELTQVQRRGIMATTLFGNTGNMGLPITLFAYGQLGLERAVVIFMISIIAMFSVGPTILSGQSESLRQRFLEALKLPPIWATLAAMIINALSLPVPILAERSLSLLGEAAIPVMLISLGIQMRRSWLWTLGKAAWYTTIVRLVIGPLLAYGIASLLGLALLDRNVLVLSAAMPAAVTMFVIAIEVKGDVTGVGRSVVATTMASVIIIMLVVYLLPPV